MRLSRLWLCALTCAVSATALSTALADEPPPGAIAGIVFDGKTQTPVAGATAILSSTTPSPAAVAGTTDADGHFRFSGLKPGTYNVLIIYGGSRSVHDRVPVSAGVTTPLRGTVDLEPETITVREHAPTILARPDPKTVKRELPYSDEAINTDTWSVGWMLLDIDPAGKVTGFRFLHRPGRGLDEIATREVWNLRFRPAEDAQGKRVASELLWKMEWPSYWWLKEVWVAAAPVGFTVAPRPITVGRSLGRSGQGSQVIGSVQRAAFLGPPSPRALPPCVGTAPLNLESVHPVYRDCSQPDLETADNEPFIARPASPPRR